VRDRIISSRRLIQAAISVVVIMAVSYYNVSILALLGVGALTGVLFGKVFCRWMCPIGYVMEMIMGSNPEAKQQQMYNYHKIGCPIAWIGGLTNRISLFKIKRDVTSCTNCGKCDRECYISTLNDTCSLYKKNKKASGVQYSCSKCMKCVEACPTGSLQYKI